MSLCSFPFVLTFIADAEKQIDRKALRGEAMTIQECIIYYMKSQGCVRLCACIGMHLCAAESMGRCSLCISCSPLQCRSSISFGVRVCTQTLTLTHRHSHSHPLAARLASHCSTDAPRATARCRARLQGSLVQAWVLSLKFADSMTCSAFSCKLASPKRTSRSATSKSSSSWAL